MSVCCKLFCLNAYFLSGDYTRTLYRKKYSIYLLLLIKQITESKQDQMLVYTEPRMRKHLDFCKNQLFFPVNFKNISFSFNN